MSLYLVFLTLTHYFYSWYLCVSIEGNINGFEFIHISFFRVQTPLRTPKKKKKFYWILLTRKRYSIVIWDFYKNDFDRFKFIWRLKMNSFLVSANLIKTTWIQSSKNYSYTKKLRAHLIYLTEWFSIQYSFTFWCSCSEVANVMDWYIVIRKFGRQSRHFWTNTLGKGMNSLILSSYEFPYCSSTRMAVALNNSRMLICH